jgi:hypothetical protein
MRQPFEKGPQMSARSTAMKAAKGEAAHCGWKRRAWEVPSWRSLPPRPDRFATWASGGAFRYSAIARRQWVTPEC